MDAFLWMMDHEEEIRGRLKAVMPEYIGKAKQIKENVELALECQ